MSTQPDPAPAPPQTPEERHASLSPEVKRRIAMGMQFLVDLNKLHLEGTEIGKAVIEGKTPGAEVGVRMMDFERNLRIAANELLRRPLRVVHADAMRSGETKLDDDAWLMRMRIRAHEARKVREAQASEESLKAPSGPAAQAESQVEEEPEADAGPRP